MASSIASAHDQLFEKASNLLKGEMHLHDGARLGKPGFLTRFKLKRAARLYQQVLELNPGNWSAMWLLGKINQRLEDPRKALYWFEQSFQHNPDQPDVARELSLSAMDLGECDIAVTAAFRATQIQPANPGLRANLALACLLDGRLEEARQAIATARQGDPKDSISKTLEEIILHFVDSGKTPPHSTPELMRYWQTARRRQA